MKNYLKLAMAFLIAVTIVSCDKDDDVEKKDSPLMYNDQTFSWNDNAELWYYNDDLYYDMNMFTGSLKVDYGSLTGSGDWLNIEFYTPTAGTLVAGDYVVSDSEEEGSCTVNFDFDVDANGQYLTTGSSAYFTSGNVSIKGSGETYTVTFDVIDDEGNKLKGVVQSNFALTTVY